MKIYFILLSLTLTTINCSGQENNKNEPFDGDINALFKKQILDKNTVGASAGYTINGKTIWQTAIGLADKQAKKPFHEETKVRMASIAKPMTAIAIMQLVEQNLIDLDAPIQRYIPDYPEQPKTQITTRHLLSHTSGLDGYKNAKEAETKINYPTLSDAVDIFKNRPLLFEPGSQYSYTTYGYTLLGNIIEKVSGLTYQTYMTENIWNKAEMANTGVEVYGAQKDNASQLYRRNKKGMVKDGVANNLSNRVPGGGLYTNVEDMLKFGNAVINNTLIKAETLHLMRQNHGLKNENNKYGFGWVLYAPNPNEGDIIGHSGAQTGCSSQILIVPEKGIVVVVLANTSGTSNDVTFFAVDLLKIASGKM